MENKQWKILLVDDEPIFASPMVIWLKSKGYEVKVAANGGEGLKSIEAEKPDIVFLDLQMPVMDGIQTLKKIREKDKDLPVIIVSATVDYNKLVELKALGITGVFHKGKDFNQGLALIEVVLKKLKQN